MTEETKLGSLVLKWWRKELRPENIQAETGSLRAFRAQLRRAENDIDTLSHASVIEFIERVQCLRGYHRCDPLVIASLARVLAHVESYDTKSIARLFGGDPPALSNLRFQRLIRVTSAADFALTLCRNLPLINGNCNVYKLGEDFLSWFSPHQSTSDRVKANWCFEYFGKSYQTNTQDSKEMETAS